MPCDSSCRPGAQRAGRKRRLTLREALAFLVEREIARKDEWRVKMAGKIAYFTPVHDLDGFDFAAQPSLDPRQNP
jgi:hypothetical protein